MNCPLCRTPMDALPQQSALAKVTSAAFGSATGAEPNMAAGTMSLAEPGTPPSYQCPKCGVKVCTPKDKPPTTVDTLEDYRKYCVMNVDWLINWKPKAGELWNAAQQEEFDRLGRFVRLLDAMTVEDRLGIDRPEPVECERVVAASGTTAEDLSRLFEEFARVRASYQLAARVQFPAWATILTGVFPLTCLLCAMYVRLTGAAAAVVSAIGYFGACAFLVFFCLRLVLPPLRLFTSTRLWLLGWGIASVLAAVVFWLVHDQVVRAGWEDVTVSVGFIALMVFLTMTTATISTKVLMRRIRRAQRDTQSAERPPLEAP